MNMQDCFDVAKTNVCKGLAVILLLWHHLAMFSPNCDIVSRAIGSYGKICVSIFLFLSGFGLMRSSRKGWKVQLTRIGRLYCNFWFVGVVFIGISALFWGKTICVVYPQTRWFGFALDMFGITGNSAYNPTWWFIGTILILYIAFPFLQKVLAIHWWILLFLAVLFFIIDVRPGIWALPFVLGMLTAKFYWTERVRTINKRALAYIIVLFLLFSVLRRVANCRLDGPLATCFVLLVANIPVSYIQTWYGRAIGMLGRHSMNIFLLHTFFYLTFFPTWFKRFYVPIGVIVLLGTSLACSFVIEFLKRKFACVYSLRRNG